MTQVENMRPLTQTGKDPCGRFLHCRATGFQRDGIKISLYANM